MNVIELRPQGIYCPAGDFFIDPMRPVERAVVTHGHADHARSGSRLYFSTSAGAPILRERLGQTLAIDARGYGQPFRLGEAWVSFHSAGHVLGSAQIRIEVRGKVWVASGDYRRARDASCEAFELVPCDTFISEATFALPVYCWPSPESIAREILAWWRSHAGGPSILFAYSFGKSQRILADLARLADRPIYVHESCEGINAIYRDAGIELAPTRLASSMPKDYSFAGDLVIAPPGASGGPWFRRFKNAQTAFASGWMRVRANQGRRVGQRGFVLSDHADWNDLVSTIRDTGAREIYLMHGKSEALQRFLQEKHGLRVAHLSSLARGAR